MVWEATCNIVKYLKCIDRDYFILITPIALYQLSVYGWIEETVRPMVQGIVQSIINAHDNLESGSITLSQGELLNSNINRSPQAYLLNPPGERSQYKYDVDKIMTVLSFKSDNHHDLGLLSW